MTPGEQAIRADEREKCIAAMKACHENGVVMFKGEPIHYSVSLDDYVQTIRNMGDEK